MSEGADIALSIAIFAVAFPAFWIFVTSMIAEIGGWNRVARRFPDREREPANARFRFCSAQLGSSLFGPSYNHILTFEVCDTGLRIRVWKVFGFLSKPIFLPWNAFRTEPFQWFIWSACRIIYGREKRDAVIIRRPLAEKIAVASGGVFGSPEQGR